jgi:hypothetical protein
VCLDSDIIILTFILITPSFSMAQPLINYDDILFVCTETLLDQKSDKETVPAIDKQRVICALVVIVIELSC